ncbi:MAG: hypothetical protein NVSMB9_15900 [Isosphaeraceae bacterium]
MAFSQANIDDVRVARDGAELFVSWASSSRGIPFQVYVDRRLAWVGTSNFCNVPVPAQAIGKNAWVEVGTVAPGETNRDFSMSLSGPGGLGDRAQLTWSGGTYLDPTAGDDIRGYRIYRSARAGEPTDYSKSVGAVAAYTGNVIFDGYGLGGFGQGGFGRARSTYRWNSNPLDSGTWTFAVVPYDRAGNVQGVPMTASVAIASSPRPPALDEKGRRLTYSYSGPATRLATLRWLASPSSNR